jgi:site-specific DNA recombinase
MQAAIYIRWSTEDQGDGTTLDVQLEACRAYLAGQGWPFNPGHIFIDEGVSGATLQRPALTRLREAVARGQVDCVVVYKLDRLSRSVVDVVKLVLDEWDGRCCVKSAREPIDTQTQAGKLRRAQEGRNPGMPAAYGFRLGPAGLPEPCEPEARVVGLIFRLYLAGLALGADIATTTAVGRAAPDAFGRRSWTGP